MSERVLPGREGVNVARCYVNDRDIEDEKTIEKAEMERRIKLFRAVKPRIPLKSRSLS